jgi:hypothetical protein
LKEIEEQVRGAKARIDFAKVDAGTEVPAYPIPIFSTTP